MDLTAAYDRLTKLGVNNLADDEPCGKEARTHLMHIPIVGDSILSRDLPYPVLFDRTEDQRAIGTPFVG